MNYNKFIVSFSAKMNSKLPGENAQYKMAPKKRLMINHNKNYINSGVLILLYLKEDELHIPFIQRNQYPGHHSGQISFPGGKYETIDESLIKTALREASEEIGINPEKIQIIGNLTPLLIAVSNFKVYPAVGFTGETPDFNIDKNEVEELIEVKLNDLLNPENINEMTFERLGQQIKAPCYLVNGHKIWGATAMILSELLEIIKKII